MIRINVNLNELDELHTTLVSTHDKMTATNNQIYTNLSKLNTMWNDPNTPVFLNQLIVDKEEIDNYTQNTKKTCDTILEFTNDLVNIAIRCNCTTNSNFTYNSDNINYLINLSLSEFIIKAIVVEDFNVNASIGLISKLGQIKKSKLTFFELLKIQKIFCYIITM